MKTPFQNYLLALRSSVQSFGWIYPVSDSVIVIIWFVCLLITLVALLGGVVQGNFSGPAGFAFLFGLIVLIMSFGVGLKLRKLYVWLRLFHNSTMAQGRVIDVNQIYISNFMRGGFGGTDLDVKNSFSLLTIDYNGLPIKCIILNRNRQFFDLIGKDILMKISVTNPTIFRIISYTDGSPIYSKEFSSFRRANIISIVVIVFALCVAALNIYVQSHSR